MEKIKFLTDSGSDITLEQENAHENLSVLNFRVTLGDLDFVSRIEMTTQQFYDALASTETLPKTAQLTVFEFEDAYEKAYNEGYTHILVTLINSEGSAGSNGCRAMLWRIPVISEIALSRDTPGKSAKKLSLSARANKKCS